MNTREEILRQRIEQIRRERAWLKFQRFCVELLQHQGYRRVRHGPPEGDGGADGVAMRPDLQPCFASVSFRWDCDKLLHDVGQWRKEHKGEPGDVVVFVVWHNPRQKTIRNLAEDVRKRFALKLEVINESTILATATRDEAWGWTCDCLGIPYEGGLDPRRASELRQKYCEVLIRNYGKIDFAGYLPGVVPYGKPLFLALEEVFVPLKVRQTYERIIGEREPKKQGKLGWWTALYTDHQDYLRRDSQHAHVGQARPGAVRVLEVGEALSENPKVVILGDPGAGKSTLLKYMTLAYAAGPEAVRERLGLPEDRTPILISIAALSQKYEKEQIGVLPFIEALVKNAGLDPETGQLLRNDMESGRAAIFLDGLDEVVTTDARLLMVKQIEGVVAAHPRNRYVVSARIVGYGTGPVGPDFAEFTVEPFDDRDIETFSGRWSIALERYAGGDTPHSVRKGEDAGKDLHESIMRNPAVRSLACNPLMLTILSLIHRQGKRMPSRRVELYALCTKTLIESWCLSRDISGIPVGEALDERDILDVLCPVAFRAHCDYPSGVIPGKELRESMIRAMIAVRGMDEKTAEREAESVLEVVQKQSGLIAERGQDAYGFLHLTFQEYLAARHIASERPAMRRRFRRFLHDPHWREVLLLAAGCLAIIMEDPKTCEVILRRVLKAGHVLFALRCICDDLRLSQEAQLAVAQHVLRRLQRGPSQQFRRRLLELVSRMPAGHARRGVEVTMVKGLSDMSGRVRPACAMAVAALARTDPRLTRVLLDHVNDPRPWVCSAAATALGWLGDASPEILGALLDRVRGTLPSAFFALARALGKLAQTSPQAVSGLLRRLGDPSADVRGAAAYGLGSLTDAGEDVRCGLLAVLGDPDPDVRLEASLALAGFGAASAEVVSELLGALREAERGLHPPSPWALATFSSAGIEALAVLKRVPGPPQARQRLAPSEALRVMARNYRQATNLLADRLHDPLSHTRRTAALALALRARETRRALEGLFPGAWHE